MSLSANVHQAVFGMDLRSALGDKTDEDEKGDGDKTTFHGGGRKSLMLGLTEHCVSKSGLSVGSWD